MLKMTAVVLTTRQERGLQLTCTNAEKRLGSEGSSSSGDLNAARSNKKGHDFAVCGEPPVMFSQFVRTEKRQGAYRHPNPLG